MRDKLIETCMKRMRDGRFKGKARDRATLEFLCGAGVALDEAGNKKEAEWVTFIAFMVSVRGYSYLEEKAEKKAA